MIESGYPGLALGYWAGLFAPPVRRRRSFSG